MQRYLIYDAGCSACERIAEEIGAITGSKLELISIWAPEAAALLDEALPEGGALIVYDAIIDDERSENAFGLLMSLNMLIETPGGFDYTGADCCSWMRNASFRKTYVEHLVGPDSMVVGIK
jgi:hypothetical protein